VPQHDPAVALAACAFNLGEGPLRVSTRTGPLFQSLAFHARGGAVFFCRDRPWRRSGARWNLS
jgi:uncharacterized membrane protein